MFLLIPTVTACGFLVHQHVLQQALHQQGLYNNGYAQAGAYFPDFGYQCRDLHAVSELAHWPPFIAQVVLHSQSLQEPHRQNFQSFILGVLSHSVSDLSWHSLHNQTGIIKAMAQANFNGSYGDAHSAADLGGEFLVAHSYDLSYHHAWRWPTRDLVQVFKQLGLNVSASDIDHCMQLGQLYTEGVHLIARRTWYIGAMRSSFLTKNFEDYYHGGLQDMISWTSVCMQDIAQWFDQTVTDANDYKFENCTIENKFRWKVGLLPQQQPSQLYQQVTKYRYNHRQSSSQLTFMPHFCTQGSSYNFDSYNSFPKSMVVGDFNDDGQQDLAVGFPYKMVGGLVSAGSVQVYPGALAQKKAFNLEGDVQLGKFGNALAVVDLNKDGVDDLAVAVPGHGQQNLTFYGQVLIYYGSTQGLSRQASLVVHSESIEYGHVLQGHDVDADGYADLVIGSPLAGSNQQGQIQWVTPSGSQSLQSPEMQDFELQGSAIVASVDLLFIGAPGFRINGSTNGRIYCYKNLSIYKVLQGKSVNSGFGTSMAINDQLLVVAEPTYSQFQTGRLTLYSLQNFEILDRIVYKHPFSMFGSLMKFDKDLLYVNSMKDSDERGMIFKYDLSGGKFIQLECQQGNPRDHYAQQFVIVDSEIIAS